MLLYVCYYYNKGYIMVVGWNIYLCYLGGLIFFFSKFKNEWYRLSNWFNKLLFLILE